ncbi:MAG: nucleotide-binding protein [Bacillota bacterium]|nr:nucleotide-binding protein [Bacillota bacterium]
MTRATTFEQGVGEAITARTATGIFIVHGHDDGMKEAVARFIEKLGLTATILNESAPKSQTLIEKLEKKAGACCFAVVLLSPDDLCCATNSSTKSPRARQNVVFEMGFFFSHLGRDNVLVLRKAGVEGLSDTDGIEYVPWEKAEWRMKLAASMREAKVPISEERLLAALGLADRHAISKPT